MLLGLPEHVTILGPEFQEVACRDLAEVAERGCLSFSSCPNALSEEQQGAAARESGESPVAQPKPQACPDACKAWVDPWEEPNPGPGRGTLQVGQMGQGHN